MSIYHFQVRVGVVGLFVFLFITIAQVSGQNATGNHTRLVPVGLKTNLLCDATGSFNLGVEIRTSNRTSFDLSGNWNPFSYSYNRKWKHLLVQPEFRWWRTETYKGHFFGAHAHYAFYNVGALSNVIFSDYMAAHRFQGWLGGAGVSYGYRWSFPKNWGLEATLGIGYARMSYSKYECQTCGRKLGSETKNFVGPTKAGITLIYTFDKKKKATPIYVLEMIPEPMPEPVFIAVSELVNPVKTEIEVLSEKYPFVLPVSEFNPEEPIYFEEEERDHTLTIYYRFNSSVIENGYANNEVTLAALLDVVHSISENKQAQISRILIAGFTSPEGSPSWNEKLAGERAKSVSNFLVEKAGVGEDAILLCNGAADWYGLRKLVEADSEIPGQQEVLHIIKNQPVNSTTTQEGRQTQLRKLNGGRTWEYLENKCFAKLRNGTFIRVYWEDKNTQMNHE